MTDVPKLRSGGPAAAHDGRAARFVRYVVPPLCVAAGVIALWCLVTYGLLRTDQRSFLPPPQQVLSKGFLDWDGSSPSWRAWSAPRRWPCPGWPSPS